MSIPIADKLIKQAENGVKLNSIERRHCVAYLMGAHPDQTNSEMGALFQVSERQIRLDKKKVKDEKIALLKEEDIGLVVVDIVLNTERQMRDIEAGKRKCRVGSRDYLEYCKTLQAMQLSTVRALQDLGYYPKNLGNMTVDKYEYTATVPVDTQKPGRPLDMVFDAEFEPVAQQVLEAAKESTTDDEESS